MYVPMLMTLLLRDKQARRDYVGGKLILWYVYGIPSHLFVTKQQSCLHTYLNVDFGYTFLTSF